MLNPDNIEHCCGTCANAKLLSVYEIMKINLHPVHPEGWIFTHTCQRFQMLTLAKRDPFTDCYSSLKLVTACN